MISNRKWRVVAVAIVVSIIVLTIYSKRDVHLWDADEVQAGVPASSLIESANDAKIDAAINREISKTKDGKVAEKETPPKAAVDKAEEILAADFDPAKEFVQIRALAPMTIFSKSYCPFSKRLKQLLHDNYSITPEPTIVELDKHKHGKELQAYLAKLTGRSTVPNVMVGTGSASRGGSDEFSLLHKEGKLAELLNIWGEKALSVKRVEKPSNI